MGASRFTTLLILALSILFFAACGGTGATLDTQNLDDGGSQLTATTTSGGWDSLPSIPLDTEDSRAASATDPGAPPPPPSGDLLQITILGKDYISMDGGTVEGDSLVLQSPEAPEGADSAALPQLAYGLYKVPGLSGLRPLSLNIECLPAGLGQSYFVGIADYFDGRWRWFGPVNLPEFQLDVHDVRGQFVTHLGNAYFIIVCPPGMGATHAKSTVTCGPANPGDPPGFPHHLVATDGQLAEKVGLSWVVGNNAQKFEIFRKPARQGAPWEKIGESTSNQYVDQPLPDYKLFFYRVRSVGEAGPSGWSNIDSGFAGGGEDPCVVGGSVTLIDGTPVPGVRVVLAGLGEEALRVTGPDGKFGFGDLPPGRYLVVPFKPELDFAPRYEFVDLTITKIAILHFNALPEAPFHRIWGLAYEFVPAVDGGEPTFAPLADLTIEARLAGQPDSAVTVQTDEHGFYHFEDLAEGVWLVKALKAGYGFLPPVHEVVVNGHNRSDRRDFLGKLLPDGGGDPGGGGGV